jgi:transposase InsO family protein
VSLFIAEALERFFAGRPLVRRVTPDLLPIIARCGDVEERRSSAADRTPPGHAHQGWAADLFVVQTLTFRTLYVLLLIAHGRRELVYVNVTAHPTAAWVWRQVVGATPWGRRPRYFVRDRDAAYGGDFAAWAQRLGIETVLTPVRAPRANAIAERVVRTLRNDGLDHLLPLDEAHLLPLDEAHLRTILAEYVAYYNTERPHRTLGLAPPLLHVRSACGPVHCRPVLGGLHHVYRRAA